MTKLIEAVEENNFSKLQQSLYLLNKTDEYGRTALMRAAALGREQFIPHLLPELYSVDDQGMTALMHACKAGFSNTHLLPEKTVKSATNMTALMFAARSGCAEMCSHLQEELGMCDAKRMTALMHAAHNGSVSCVKHLTKELHAKDRRGRTALMWAGLTQHSEMFDSLQTEAGAQDDEGFTALMRFVESAEQHEQNLAALVEAEGGLQAADGTTALYLALQILHFYDEKPQKLREMQNRIYFQRLAELEVAITKIDRTYYNLLITPELFPIVANKTSPECWPALMFSALDVGRGDLLILLDKSYQKYLRLTHDMQALKTDRHLVKAIGHLLLSNTPLVVDFIRKQRVSTKETIMNYLKSVKSISGRSWFTVLNKQGDLGKVKSERGYFDVFQTHYEKVMQAANTQWG